MNFEQRDNLAQPVRVMQIITGALVMGVVVFAGIVIAIGEPLEEDEQPFLAYIGVAFAMVALPPAVMVPRVIASQGEPTAEVYQTSLIVGLAILEGAAFMNLIAYLIESQSYSLAVAGMLAVFMLMQFPTAGRVVEWIERRHRDARERDAFRR